MTYSLKLSMLVTLMAMSVSSLAISGEQCVGFGPQTPRDISVKEGTNSQNFNLAKSTKKMNLCNIHFHTNAEHKGPGFSIFAGKGTHGGYRCNGTPDLTKAELTPLQSQKKGHTGEHHSKSICHGVKPGDTIEVHWVYSSCTVKPGKGLGACLSSKCANPELRVESKVFVVVNDTSALDFAQFTQKNEKENGFHQPLALPKDKDPAVLFSGSTTGPKYTQAKCSPLQVTWNVRPNCAKVDISSLNKWCGNNVFEENHAHGVRQLVTAPELLSKIQ